MQHLTRRWWILALAVPLGQFALAQNGTRAATGDLHWVATWATAQQQPGFGRGGFGGRGPVAPAAAAPGQQAPAAAQAVTPPTAPPATPAAPASTLNNQTARMIIRTSIGGSRVRVHFSNAFGTLPLDMGAAHVAIRSRDSAIVAGSDRPLLFNGKTSARVLPGAVLLSDPVDLVVPELSDLAISVYVPGNSGVASQHSQALHTTYISMQGDTTSQLEMADATTTRAWYWISSVDVLAPADAGAIVALGDSITDGTTSTVDANRSWPSLLSERLVANPATANLSVLNMGIAGNQILGDGAGVAALARFDRDVLSQTGVKWLMILEGINDMNLAGRGGATTTGLALTADDLIGGMKQMIERAHTHGIKVIGCTLTPFGGASDAVEAMRQDLNLFIRTSGTFDAVVDFDKVIQDPADPRQFIKAYNNTDRLHPNDAGYKAMADAIDVSMFSPQSTSPARR
jgi:lysophospholipase L1-like esterase